MTVGFFSGGLLAADPVTTDDGKTAYKLQVSGGGAGGGGDASAANQTRTQAVPGSNSAYATGVQGVDGGKAVPISAAALPLPTGAATAAKQPALGTAGTASTDVLTIQGIAGGTAQNMAVANGADVALGNTADAAYASTDGSAAGTAIALLKGLFVRLAGNLSVAGRDAGNVARALRTDTKGGLLPGGATPATTRTSVTANGSPIILAADATTVGVKFTLETSPTAPVFISYTSTASSTVYDEILPSGAAVGTRLFVEFPVTTAITAFSTAAFTIAATRWTPA